MTHSGGRFAAPQPEEFLHLVDRHLPGIEQDGHGRMPQQVRVHPLDDARLMGTRRDHGLHGSDGVVRVAIAFEQVATAAWLRSSDAAPEPGWAGSARSGWPRPWHG